MTTSAIELKKNIGKTVIKLNSDILELLHIFKKGKSSSDKDLALETRVKNSKNSLKETVLKLESQPDYIKSEGLTKLIKLMSTSIETADTLFETNKGYEEISEEEVKATQDLAKKSIEDTDPNSTSSLIPAIVHLSIFSSH